MNVFLFGASGGTGQQLLKRLLDAGHTVQALVRRPERFNAPESPRLQVIRGDVLQPETFRHALAGTDVVISCLGQGKSTKATTVYSEGGANILDAMRAHGVRKLFVLTSALVDESDPGTNTFFLRRIIRPIFRRVYADMALLERLLEQNRDVDWVCVRPTGFTNKPFTSSYRVSLNHAPPGGLQISRAEVADFIMQQLESDEYAGQKPVLAY